jgi:hypothetical protein
MKHKDWLVIYDKKKDDYFAIEDKHEGQTPRMIGKHEVVGIVSFKHAADAIEYIRFIHATQPFNGKRRRK